MENGPFIDGLPINSMVIFHGELLNNQMATGKNSWCFWRLSCMFKGKRRWKKRRKSGSSGPFGNAILSAFPHGQSS